MNAVVGKRKEKNESGVAVVTKLDEGKERRCDCVGGRRLFKALRVGNPKLAVCGVAPRHFPDSGSTFKLPANDIWG